MKVYFKIIGWIVLLNWFLEIIMLSVYMGTNFSRLDTSTRGLLVVALISMIVIGPAIGLLFLYQNKLTNRFEELKQEVNVYQINTEKKLDKIIPKQAELEYDIEDIKRDINRKFEKKD